MFTAVLLAAFGLAWWQASRFLPEAALMPLSVASLGTVLGAVQLVQELRGRSGKVGDDDEADAPEHAGGRRAAGYLAVVACYIGLVWLVGLLAATALWVASFLLLVSRMRWHFAVVYTAAAVGGVWLLSNVLGVHLPVGVLPILR